MPLNATCPVCQTGHRLADTLGGKKIRCKSCGATFLVEGPSAEGADDGQIAEGKPPEKAAASIPVALETVRPRPRQSDGYDKPRSRQPRRQPVSAFPVWIVLVVGGLIVLMGMAALGVGAYFVFMRGFDDVAGSWPEPAPLGDRNGVNRFTPQQIVTVHVEGVKDKYTYDAVVQGLLSTANAGQGRALTGRQDGERAAFLVAPVTDPDAFAKRITCGTVRSVRGRIITMVATPAPRPAADDPISVALFNLKSDSKRFDAINQLKSMQPVEQRRREVMNAVKEYRNAPGVFPGHIEEIMGNWAAAEDVPLLIDMLSRRQQNDLNRNGPLIRALGRLKDQRALDVLGDCLGDFFNRGDAANALRAFGPAAEKVVLKQIHHQDWQTQKLVCNVLAAIGTEASLPSLEAVVASRNILVDNEAKAAILAIKARQRKA
jgi:hypothetical protein